MMGTVAHFLPFAALAGGVLILLMPRLLNYVVAVYLILVGAIGLNNILSFHPLMAEGLLRFQCAWRLLRSTE
jgi:hypothetical protein